MAKPNFDTLDVLVVDPSPHMTTLVVSMLRHLKVGKVQEAASSSAALTKLQQRKFNVVVIEDNIAPVDGVELTKALRAMTDCPSRDAAVIMMSSAPGAARIAEARDAGITEFLRKPFAGNHLATRLESILVAPRAFIAAPGYAGPDRRRRERSPSGPDRRRSGTDE
jgi:two-component system, chemotaxis family, chemotaxis protein CheY